MIVFKTIASIKNYLKSQKASGKSLGFVPTMGALHQGHISLIKKSLLNSDVTICSIFVNPTQFNNASDLENYPRTIESDMKLLCEANCDVLFLPSVSEMYPEGKLKESSDYGKILQVLEGEKRPGHFDGVITIVSKLFSIIEPNQVFFGQKDYQQCMVVAELIKRNFRDIKLFIEPTHREANGLAMSSRNERLSETEKTHALNISKALFFIKDSWGTDTIEAILSKAKKIVEAENKLKVEYLEVCDKNSLDLLRGNSNDHKNAVALAAVFCGDVRLIDNIIIEGKA